MFKDVTSRYDMSSATTEVVIMLAVAFLLGFLFCYFRNKSSDED